MKKKVSEKDILIIIGKILKVNHNSLLKIDNYSKIKSWDSLAQLDIISALDKKLGGQIGKVKNIIAKSKFIVSHVTSNEIEREQRRLSKTIVKGINIKSE